MKLCNICKVIKIKNNYTVCYDCNQKCDSASENETVPAYKKESIPKTIKNCLWINYFKDSRIGVCQCCKREQITIGNFHAGHIKAEAHGGKTALDNLIPLCQLCNCSMSTSNVFDFISKYNLHYGL
jgi:hypothetical protein